MPKLKNLNGEEVIAILSLFGFNIISQRGSHAKLRRILAGSIKQTLTIPRHDELDKGTLKAIYKQSSKFIPEETLKGYFYNV